MCGIFAYVGPRHNAAELTLEGLKVLEYRGYDSWGIAIESKAEGGKSHVTIEKHVGKIGEAKTTLSASTIAIGHTRWATHGGVTDFNAHPHTNDSGKVAVVHNGIVENYQEHKSRLLQAGHHFHSETDTEVIAHLIDEDQKQMSFRSAVLSTFPKLHGSNAIVALDADSKTVVACRNGSPLVVGIGHNEYILGSDVTALLPYTQTVYFLHDGEAVDLSHAGIRLYDISTQEEKKLITEKIEWTAEKAQKDGHPHYMIKEILEQRHTIAKALQLNRDVTSALFQTLQSATHVVVSGCGTAYHCCLMSQYLFARVGIDARAIPANEFSPFASLVNSSSVFIAVSQSGETADTLIAARAAKANGAHIVAIVNARASTLERMADTVLSVGAGPEISVVSTKAFTAQVATIYALAHAMSSVDDNISERVETSLTRWLDISYMTHVREVAASLVETQDIYVIGRHENFPAALETALKIKEASYLHAEGFAAGELKHGVISLIQKGTPCIVLASEDDRKPEILSSAIELKTRGAKIIGIAPFLSEVFDVHLATPDIGELTPVANAIVGQLLGYYLSVGRGCDPDKPRNLAKSVTVK